MADQPELSLVIPCYNEEGICARSSRRCAARWNRLQVLRNHSSPRLQPDQVLGNPQGTRDGRPPRARSVLPSTAASPQRCGRACRAARGRVIVTRDADLQNDRATCRNCWRRLKLCDCVCGTRVAARAGAMFVRVRSSRIANWVNRFVRRKHQRPGCCLPAFKARVHRKPEIFQGMHRFLPTLFQNRGVHRHGDSG